MKKSYKTEINPTQEQINKINKTLGVCRFVYNFFINKNKEIYEKEKRFLTGYDFSKWLNNEFIPNNPDYKWIKEVPSKSVKQSIMHGDLAFRNFFNHKSHFPKYKKKKQNNVKMYLPKNNPTDFPVERHRIKVPVLGWVRLKEKGYIPTNAKVRSCTISKIADRYYISVLVEEKEKQEQRNNDFGIGIAIGLKNHLTCSNGIKKGNINETKVVKFLEKKLKREHRRLTKKYKMKGETTHKNIQKQIIKIQRLYRRLSNIRTNYINECINEIVKIKPSYITLEDIDVKKMQMKPDLVKMILKQKFYEFRIRLHNKCKEYNIELRISDKVPLVNEKCNGLVNASYQTSLDLRDCQTYKLAE